MINKQQLLDFWAKPEMQGMRESLVKDCPEIPGYAPGNVEVEKQAADWKYLSGLRDGYIFCLNNLGVKVD